MKNIKIWRILIGVLFIYSFSYCSHRGHDTYDWYESMAGYQNALQFAKNNASILENSFFYGEIDYYSIWSYYSISGSTYIIVRKFHKKDIIFYRIYQYRGNLEWLKQFDEKKVSSFIFRNFAALDDIPLTFNVKKMILYMNIFFVLHMIHSLQMIQLQMIF